MIISREKPEMCRCASDLTEGQPYCQKCGLIRDHNLPDNVNHGFATMSMVP